MTTKVYNMSKSKDQLTIRLLPNKCKIWGAVIVAAAILPAIIIHQTATSLSPTGKELVKATTFGIFIIGLSLIAWAKDKIEDELTFLIRLKAMAYTFIWAVFYAAFMPFANAIVGNGVIEMSSYQLVFTMLIAYLLMYYVQKRKR